MNINVGIIAFISAAWICIFCFAVQIYMNHFGNTAGCSVELTSCRCLLEDTRQKFEDCLNNTKHLETRITEMDESMNNLEQRLHQCLDSLNDHLEKVKACEHIKESRDDLHQRLHQCLGSLNEQTEKAQKCEHSVRYCVKNSCQCKNPCDVPFLQRLKWLFCF